MHITIVILFLSWFFNVITCVDVPPARKRSLYDIAVQQDRRALIKWTPRIGASRHSRPYTLLRSLIVKVEGPEKITRAEDLTLTTIITNTGSKTLMLVNEPSGVLYSRLPTERFYVTHSTGMIPQFKGVQVKFSIRKAIELGDVTSLDPGQSISVIHRLSEAYDFAGTGFGHYNFKPRNRFFVVNPATKRVTMVQAGSTHEISVKWSGQLFARGDDIVAKPLDLTPIRFGFRSKCKENKGHVESGRQMIADSIQQALNDLHDTNSERYVTWFGHSDVDHRTAVRDTLNGILEFVERAYYSCSTSKTWCPPGTIAVPGYFQIGDIYESRWLTICPSFFVLTAKDAIAPAFIPILIRYKRFTKLDGNVKGAEECKALAKTDPNSAVKNADSFVGFVLDE